MMDGANALGPMGGVMGGMMGALLLGLLVLVGLLVLMLFLYFRRPVGPVAPAGLAPSGFSGACEPGDASESSAAGPGREQDSFLVVPDISGYTRFLAATRFSLGHAQYIISELLNALIEAGAPELALSKIEGDAVLLWGRAGTDGRLSGDALDVVLVRLLDAFYRKREELRCANICPCAACRHIDALDVKVLAHRGNVLSYRLASFHELSGLPVIVVHRLLKNDLKLERYLMVTEQAMPARGLPGIGPGREHVQDYPDVGTVKCRVFEFDPGSLPVPAGERSDFTAGSRPIDLARKLGRNLGTLRHSLSLSHDRH